MAKKILIVEDDPLITKIYSTRLTIDGYEVQNAENGEIAVTKAKDFLPDLIMLDVMMPKLDGFECLKALRALPEFMKTPIIMYSNLGAEEEQVRAKELGVTEFFVKANISPTQLMVSIKKYLGDDAGGSNADPTSQQSTTIQGTPVIPSAQDDSNTSSDTVA